MTIVIVVWLAVLTAAVLALACSLCRIGAEAERDGDRLERRADTGRT